MKIAVLWWIILILQLILRKEYGIIILPGMSLWHKLLDRTTDVQIVQAFSFS